MTDYNKSTDFAIKDTYATGNPLKRTSGTEVDDEFNAIEVAVATKEDSANKGVAGGYCPLDAGGLVDPTDLPAATESAQGAAELATDAEVNAGTDDTRIITPLKLATEFTARNLDSDQTPTFDGATFTSDINGTIAGFSEDVTAVNFNGNLVGGTVEATTGEFSGIVTVGTSDVILSPAGALQTTGAANIGTGLTANRAIFLGASETQVIQSRFDNTSSEAQWLSFQDSGDSNNVRGSFVSPTGSDDVEYRAGGGVGTRVWRSQDGDQTLYLDVEPDIGGNPLGLQHLDDVDVTTEAPATGDLLRYDGTDFVPVQNNTLVATFNDNGGGSDILGTYSSIGTNVKKIVLLFDEVGVDNIDADIGVELGDSGSWTPTYDGNVLRHVDGGGNSNNWSSFDTTIGIVVDVDNVSNSLSGRVVLEKLDASNKWILQGLIKKTGDDDFWQSIGTIDNGATAVDRIRVSVDDNAYNFDAGTVEVRLYE